MNKEQYLKQLGAHLGKLTAAERNDIVGDIEEFFVCAAREGRTEADIAARLGDPKKLAKEYLAQSHIESANLRRTPKSMFLAFMYAAGLGIVNACYALFVVGIGYVVIGALYFSSVCVGLGGVATLFFSLLSAAGNGVTLALGILACIALICVSILFFIGIMTLSKAFHRGNMAFLNRISDKIKETGARK